MYCDGRSPSPFREFEPSNFAIATGRLTSEAFSESSDSRHKVAHSSRIVANYHLGTLGSICFLLCGENFGKNNSQLFLFSFPSSGSQKERDHHTMVSFCLVLLAMAKISTALPSTATDVVLVPLGSSIPRFKVDFC